MSQFPHLPSHTQWRLSLFLVLLLLRDHRSGVNLPSSTFPRLGRSQSRPRDTEVKPLSCQVTSLSYQRHMLHPHATLILGGRSAQAGSASPCRCGLEGPAHPTAAHRAHSSPRRTPCGAPLLLALGGSSRCWSPVSGGVLFPGTIQRCERCFVTFHVVPRTTPPFRKPRPTRQQGGAPPFKT